MKIFNPTISGSSQASGSFTISGNLNTSQGITGSLLGTASWAINTLTASFLPVGTYSITASWAQSASNAVNARTASFLPVGTYNITSSWTTNSISSSLASRNLLTASVSSNTIAFTKGDGSTFNITVNTGSSGGGSVGTLQQVTEQGASTTVPITASIVSASSFTGSLFGTASHAITASYALSSAGGGGGSFSLAGATDVSFSALTDGDLIRYNGIAEKWQNTNLGLSLTPTLTMDSTFYFPGNATISNYNSYSLASVFAEVKVGSTLIVSNSQVTKNGGSLSWTDSSALTGSRTLYVQVQDFGDVASEITTASYDVVNATFRYFRFYPTASTSHTMMTTWRLYVSNSQTGTSYPGIMTSNTAPSPYVATASNFQSNYDPWKAFDNSNFTSWWNLGAPNYNNTWLQIDLGSEITIKSMDLYYYNSIGYANFTRGEVYGSNSSSFETGQVKLASFTGGGSTIRTLLG